jgi:predicted CoA-binding protein
MKEQAVLTWTHDPQKPERLTARLEHLIKKGYTIVSVVPTAYVGGLYASITDAIIIIETSEKTS